MFNRLFSLYTRKDIVKDNSEQEGDKDKLIILYELNTFGYFMLGTGILIIGGTVFYKLFADLKNEILQLKFKMNMMADDITFTNDLILVK